MVLTSGTRLGAYEILGALGAGGMGEVYRAYDTRLGREVAIKVLPESVGQDAERLSRFEREARTASSLNHPNILTIFEIGESGGGRFIVSELVAGETLRAKLSGAATPPLGPARASEPAESAAAAAVEGRAKRLPIEDAIAIAIQIAEGLAVAHDAGIVHRDLKPENVMIRPDAIVKLLDFGLAKLVRNTDIAADQTGFATVPARTGAGSVSGTILYMSPEQARGLELDARSDIFSFGILVYEMLTGITPFEGETSAHVLVAILERPAMPCGELRPDIPPALRRIVARSLEKNRDYRYGSGRELLADLKTLRSSTSSSARTAAAKPPPSIAVLPFADMSPHKDQEYFCEGIAEELINALTKISALRVASRTSTFRFKGSEDIHRIGEQLGVATVLEGSVRTGGTRLRVTAQLVNVADGYQLWAERYDRQLQEVFDIQDEISLAIVDALKVKLLGDDDSALAKRQTNNVEAYQLCLKARYHWYRWTEDAFRKAVDLFEEALRLDPGYALAHFGLGDCCNASAFVGLSEPATLLRARSSLEQAIALDSQLAEAHAILGILQGLACWDWRAADRSFARAMDITARSAHVHSAYGEYLLKSGRPDRAMELAKRAVELDPLSPMWNMGIALTHYGRREYHDAIRQADVTLDLEPSYWWAHAFAGLSWSALDDAAQAVAAMERAVTCSGGIPYANGWLGFVLGKAGRTADAERQVKVLLDRGASGYVPPLSIACVYVGLDRLDEAFTWLDRSLELHDPQLPFHLTACGVLDDLRGDPRFARLVSRVGI